MGLIDLQVIVRDGVFIKAGQFCTDFLFKLTQGYAREWHNIKGQRARQFHDIVEASCCDGFVRQNKILVKHRFTTAGNHFIHCFQGYPIRMVHWHCGIGKQECRKTDILIYVGDITVSVQGDLLAGVRLNPGAGRDLAEIFVNQLQYFGFIDIATNGQGGIIGPIPAQEKIFQIIQRSGVQVFRITNNRPGIGMIRRIECRGINFIKASIRTVVHILATLVLDGIALYFKFFLSNGIQ